MDTSKLDLGNVVDDEMLEMLHYFAENTTERIFHHIERLKVKDTGALKNSIKATVHNMAGGNSALVTFYFAYYGTFVEQAVGKYYGVDKDLGKGVGVKSKNIGAPLITDSDYSAMTGIIKGIPNNVFKGKRRGEWHRPRPFLMSEIKYQLKKIQWRMLSEIGYTASAHIIKDLCDVFDPSGKSTEDFLQSLGFEEVKRRGIN